MCDSLDCDHLVPGEAEAKLDALFAAAFDGFTHPYSDEEMAEERKALDAHFASLVNDGDFKVRLFSGGGFRAQRSSGEG